ncbi:hypothetical protein QUB68_11335 [Microcoleus sp. A006_D1]|uniref:hypothetical protein n=1 Tax=Microcoleus sp. A006_D1 TaxID=3055267 RepID=UPI002FD66846
MGTAPHPTDIHLNYYQSSIDCLELLLARIRCSIVDVGWGNLLENNRSLAYL